MDASPGRAWEVCRECEKSVSILRAVQPLQRGRLAAQYVPRALHVRLGRALVADRQPEHVATVELRVRDEDLAGRVDGGQQPLVVLVRTLATEAHDGERPRCAQLPPGFVAHPVLEQLSQT